MLLLRRFLVVVVVGGGVISYCLHSFSHPPLSFSLSFFLSFSLQSSNKVVGAFGLSDPLTLGIAVHSEDDSAVISYCTRFASSDFKDCENLWKKFSRDGVVCLLLLLLLFRSYYLSFLIDFIPSPLLTFPSPPARQWK